VALSLGGFVAEPSLSGLCPLARCLRTQASRCILDTTRVVGGDQIANIHKFHQVSADLEEPDRVFLKSQNHCLAVNQHSGGCLLSPGSRTFDKLFEDELQMWAWLDIKTPNRPNRPTFKLLST